MKQLAFILIGLFIPGYLWATDLSAVDILTRIDQNRTADDIVSTSSLTIHGPRGSRTMKAKSWGKGTENSFTEFLAPAREKGTKMLKLKNKLWIYYPRVDRIVKIAGHMLRQSLMGSDLSYEDMMENPKMVEMYNATIEEETQLFERSCWILGLTAKESTVTYQARKIWVDQERFLPLKEEFYTKQGKLLKTAEIQEVFQVQNRWYPKKMWFKDAFKQGKGTELLIHTIKFDVAIPSSRFSKAALRR